MPITEVVNNSALLTVRFTGAAFLIKEQAVSIHSHLTEDKMSWTFTNGFPTKILFSLLISDCGFVIFTIKLFDLMFIAQ